jgi:hypothetical protein
MSADAAATDSAPGRSASRHKILIRIHLRSSAAESSCLRRQPGRPRPPPAWRSMPPGPPSSGTPQAHRRPPARSPATAVQIPPPQPVRPERQTIAAPLSVLPTQRCAPRRTRPPVSLPVAPRPQNASARRNPYAQSDRVRTQPPRRHGSPRRPPTRIRPPQPVRPERPRPHPTTPPAWQPTPSANPHSPAATRAPREIAAAPPPHLSAVLGGSCYPPTQPVRAPQVTRQMRSTRTRGGGRRYLPAWPVRPRRGARRAPRCRPPRAEPPAIPCGRASRACPGSRCPNARASTPR